MGPRTRQPRDAEETRNSLSTARSLVNDQIAKHKALTDEQVMYLEKGMGLVCEHVEDDTSYHDRVWRLQKEALDAARQAKGNGKDKECRIA